MAMVPYGPAGGGSRSVTSVDLQVHPAESADVHLPMPGPRFSVMRPTLLLPAGVRVSVAGDMPYDVAARWWDSLTVAGSAASQWYTAQVNGWPGGKDRRDGGR